MDEGRDRNREEDKYENEENNKEYKKEMKKEKINEKPTNKQTVHYNCQNRMSQSILLSFKTMLNDPATGTNNKHSQNLQRKINTTEMCHLPVQILLYCMLVCVCMCACTCMCAQLMILLLRFV
jgi:hypothetical protein